jgi:hypothetical protein
LEMGTGGEGGTIPAGSLFSMRPDDCESDDSARADAFSDIITALVATIAALAAFLMRPLLDCFSISAVPSVGWHFASGRSRKNW